MLLQLSVYKCIGPDGIHPRVGMKGMDNVIARPLSVSGSLRNLERSQSAGSYKMLFQFSRMARKKTLLIIGLSVSLQCLVKLWRHYSESY